VVGNAQVVLARQAARTSSPVQVGSSGPAVPWVDKEKEEACCPGVA
jgi:hypothetical protein